MHLVNEQTISTQCLTELVDDTFCPSKNYGSRRRYLLVGKKTFDKRADIKDRDIKRDMQREIKIRGK